MGKSNVNKWISFLLVFFSIALVILVLRMQIQVSDLTKVENKRIQSIFLADELRQSSDDLTRFARLFVQTREEKYLDYYRRILDIRSGNVPRPIGYEQVYWDLICGGDSTLLTKNLGEKEALLKRMELLGFSENEFYKLKLAESRSNNLTKMEYTSFDLARKNENQHDLELSRKLLFGQQYMEAKANIMIPIKEFQVSVDERTKEELQMLQLKIKMSQYAIIISSLLVLIFAFIFQRMVKR